MSNNAKGTSPEQVAKALVNYLHANPQSKTAISQADTPETVVSEIRELPPEGQRLISLLAGIGKDSLHSAPIASPELRDLREWVLSWKAPLEEVAALLSSGVGGPKDVFKNVIAGVSSYCSYYPAIQVGLLHTEFTGRRGAKLFDNVEPISEMAKTGGGILEHVATAYSQLTQAGCALGGHDKEDDLQTLARVVRAVRTICKVRQISFKAVMRKAAQLAEAERVPAVAEKGENNP